MLTLFSAPKSFDDPHIAMIQRNAIRSWKALDEGCEVLLFGNEPGLMEAAAEMEVRLLPLEDRSPSGAPLVDELFQRAKEATAHPTMCYLNADIILLRDFLPSVQEVYRIFPDFLVVGNRWDLDIDHDMNFDKQGLDALHAELAARGRPHPPAGSDYFVFKRHQFGDIPEFALGRAGWDNWMMYKARREGIPLVDASSTITVVHQNHDYAHLPDGEPHYRHPESMHNIHLAGGQEAMFRLRDADWKLTPDGLRKKRFQEWQYPRRFEADILSSVGTGFLGRLVRMAFHPGHALRYVRSKVLSQQANPEIRSEKGDS